MREGRISRTFLASLTLSADMAVSAGHVHAVAGVCEWRVIVFEALSRVWTIAVIPAGYGFWPSEIPGAMQVNTYAEILRTKF